MQVLVIFVGLVLIAFGLYFATGGFGTESASGSTGRLQITGPAWLILIVIGVAVVIFGATNEFGDGDTTGAATPEASTTTIGVSETTMTTAAVRPSTAEPEPSTTEDAAPAGCAVNITFAFASIRDEPNVGARELLQVPAGTYAVLEESTVSFAGNDQHWFLISVDGVEGWIQDTTILIASKSADCFN